MSSEFNPYGLSQPPSVGGSQATLRGESPYLRSPENNLPKESLTSIPREFAPLLQDQPPAPYNSSPLANKESGYLTDPRPAKRPFYKTLWFWIAAIIIVAAAVVLPVYFVVIRPKHDSKTSSGSVATGSSNSTGTTTTGSSQALVQFGGDGSTVTKEDGTTFVYNNSFGGYCEYMVLTPCYPIFASEGLRRRKMRPLAQVPNGTRSKRSFDRQVVPSIIYSIRFTRHMSSCRFCGTTCASGPLSGLTGAVCRPVSTRLILNRETSTNPFTYGIGVSNAENPYDNSARPNSWTPPLNQSWRWGEDRINGVNLGGLFVPEPFIVPELFETNPGAVDEWTLSTILAGKGQLQEVLENHYYTFITEEDIAQIAGAGLNWIRVPIPFWAIETWQDVGVDGSGQTVAEPFLARVCWK